MTPHALQELGFEETVDAEGAEAQEREDRPRRKRAVRRALWLLAVIALIAAFVAGVGALLGLTFAPEQTKQFIGEATTQVAHTARTAVQAEPKVILGAPGGQAEVDACPGSWVRMIDYNDDTGFNVPVYSAHNGCFGFGGRGDVILPLGIGDQIEVVDQAGVSQQYRVIELRDTPQHQTTTDHLAGMPGPIILQTCYWDDATMKFVSITPVV